MLSSIKMVFVCACVKTFQRVLCYASNNLYIQSVY